MVNRKVREINKIVINQIQYKANLLTVHGIVQGVGFRPYIHHLAIKHQISGYVRNTGGEVEVLLYADTRKIHDFLRELELKPCENSLITNIQVKDIILERIPSGFEILISESEKEKLRIPILPPDLPTCTKCEKELMDRNNRRYLNPFISCMSCGPRFTIMERLPYDRDTTSMNKFTMCPACNLEYKDLNDRRYYAQTISCHDCGPELIYEEKRGSDALHEVINAIKEGGIVAVKGIGGYHFVCSPHFNDTILLLRTLKGREQKPFAVMFPNMEQIRKCCDVSELEERMLTSLSRPITLLSLKKNPFAESVNWNGLDCGAFLPHTPLQILLTRELGPLIMTSANQSGSPIIYHDEEVHELTKKGLSGVLWHKRNIIRPVEDSVVRCVINEIQLIRRSRGYVPYPVSMINSDQKIFALGSDLKAVFCLYEKGKAILSQPFGDLQELSCYKKWKEGIQDLCSLFAFVPDVTVCDMHPGYFSSKEASNHTIRVQHHHAHIASVMAEHNLSGKVMGVAFDGTGYGTDGSIWGSEFLVCEGAEFKRVSHLKYTALLGGDESSKDARKTAACFLIEEEFENTIDLENIKMIKKAVKSNINCTKSSSMGRLFDAVCSLLGLCHYNQYEGECAVRLENCAKMAQKENVQPYPVSFDIKEREDGWVIEYKNLLKEIVLHRHRQKEMALGFHYAIADMILEMCRKIREKENSNQVALSGGVFQNGLLLERTMRLLKSNHFEVYINEKVPPNDGGIALGQTLIAIRSENSCV